MPSTPTPELHLTDPFPTSREDRLKQILVDGGIVRINGIEICAGIYTAESVLAAEAFALRPIGKYGTLELDRIDGGHLSLSLGGTWAVEILPARDR